MAPPCFEPSDWCYEQARGGVIEMAYGAHNGDPRWLMRLTPVARRGLAVMLSDA